MHEAAYRTAPLNPETFSAFKAALFLDRRFRFHQLWGMEHLTFQSQSSLRRASACTAYRRAGFHDHAAGFYEAQVVPKGPVRPATRTPTGPGAPVATSLMPTHLKSVDQASNTVRFAGK